MVDLRTASREALLAVIARQQQEILGLQRTVAEQQAELARLHQRAAEQQLTIGRLEARVRDLAAGGGRGGRGELPGHKSSEAAGPAAARLRAAAG